MKTFTLVAATLVAGMSFALAQSATHEPAGTHGTVGAHAGCILVRARLDDPTARDESALSVPPGTGVSRTGRCRLAWLCPAPSLCLMAS